MLFTPFIMRRAPRPRVVGFQKFTSASGSTSSYNLTVPCLRRRSDKQRFIIFGYWDRSGSSGSPLDISTMTLGGVSTTPVESQVLNESNQKLFVMREISHPGGSSSLTLSMSFNYVVIARIVHVYELDDCNEGHYINVKNVTTGTTRSVNVAGSTPVEEGSLILGSGAIPKSTSDPVLSGLSNNQISVISSSHQLITGEEFPTPRYPVTKTLTFSSSSSIEAMVQGAVWR